MVHLGRLEGRRIDMAGIAFGRGRNMGRWLAQRIRPVVAG